MHGSDRSERERSSPVLGFDFRAPSKEGGRWAEGQGGGCLGARPLVAATNQRRARRVPNGGVGTPAAKPVPMQSAKIRLGRSVATRFRRREEEERGACRRRRRNRFRVNSPAPPPCAPRKCQIHAPPMQSSSLHPPSAKNILRSFAVPGAIDTYLVESSQKTAQFVPDRGPFLKISDRKVAAQKFNCSITFNAVVFILLVLLI